MQPQRITGWLRVRAATTPDGERQVMTTLPSGASFMLPREQALSLAFAVLITARDLFPNSAELDAAVVRAYDGCGGLIDPPGVQ